MRILTIDFRLLDAPESGHAYLAQTLALPSWLNARMTPADVWYHRPSKTIGVKTSSVLSFR